MAAHAYEVRRRPERKQGLFPTFVRALFYAFSEKGWAGELLLAILFAAIPIAGYFIIKGWEFEISTLVRDSAPRLLPGWRNPWKKLERGFLIRMAGFLYNFPVYLLLGVTLYLWLEPFIGALFSEEARNVPLDIVYSRGLGLRLGMIAVTAIVAFLLNSLYWCGYLRYINTRRYSLFFDLATNFELTFRTILDDLVVTIYIAAATAIAGGLDSLLGAGLTATGFGAFLAPILLPAVTFTFLSMFRGYIFGVLTTETFGATRR